jgi:Skp family chaperone for outer membrane proteins
MIGSSASGSAARTQAEAAVYAADKQYEASNKAIAEQSRQFDTQLALIEPYRQAGVQSLSALSYGMGLGSPNAAKTTQNAMTPQIATVGQIAPARSYELKGLLTDAQTELANLTQQRQELQSTIQRGGFGAGLNPFNAQNMLRQLDAEIQDRQGKLTGYQSELSTVQAGLAQPQTPGATQGASDQSQPLEFGSLMKDFTYTDTDPGVQFRLKENQKAIERAAASRGNVLGGATLKALSRYTQDYASNEYQNAFNRYQTERSNKYGMLSSLAGLGQSAANTQAASSQNYANNVSSLLTGSAAAQGDYATQAANARASGYLGSANAWSSALSGAGNSIMQGVLLNSLFNKKKTG